MTDEELAAIRARAEAATPGPWNVFRYGYGDGAYARVWAGDPDDGAIAHVHEDKWYFGVERDAPFIAHARQDVPALLAEVERLRAENAALRELVPQLMESADVLAKVGSWSFDITDEEVTAAENALAQARALLST